MGTAAILVLGLMYAISRICTSIERLELKALEHKNTELIMQSSVDEAKQLNWLAEKRIKLQEKENEGFKLKRLKGLEAEEIPEYKKG